MDVKPAASPAGGWVRARRQDRDRFMAGKGRGEGRAVFQLRDTPHCAVLSSLWAGAATPANDQGQFRRGDNRPQPALCHCAARAIFA
jgi:hypothetical protein